MATRLLPQLTLEVRRLFHILRGFNIIEFLGKRLGPLKGYIILLLCKLR